MTHATLNTDPKTMHSFAEFYRFYLAEHSNATCRRLHFVGSSLALLFLWSFAWSGKAGFIAAALVCGYGFAWVAHFVFEKNRPATFKRPLYSLMGDWRMYFDIWTKRIPF